MRCSLVYIFCFVAVIIALEIFIISKIISYSSLQWNHYNQSRFCEFRDQAFFSSLPKVVSLNECSHHCSQSFECTHYSWSNKNICLLKQGNISKSSAVFIIDRSSWCGLTMQKPHKTSHINRVLCNINFFASLSLSKYMPCGQKPKFKNYLI